MDKLDLEVLVSTVTIFVTINQMELCLVNWGEYQIPVGPLSLSLCPNSFLCSSQVSAKEENSYSL